MNLSLKSNFLLASFSILLLTTTASAQYNPESFSAMKWRLVGPHRAGRVTAVAGIPGKPAIYYFGTPGGGVWKTTDGGRVWKPIFDDTHVASIGALALAPSNPDIIYVGTGEETEGNGVYKSTDGGKTWMNLGLRNTHHISSLIVDPRNPNIVLAGSLDFFNSSTEKGIFKTTDGGKTWKKIVTGLPQNVIARVVREDPARKGLLYAGTETGVYLSFDGGDSWQPMQFNLPTTSVRDLNVHGDDLVAATYGRGLWILDDLSPLRQVNIEVGSAGAHLFKPATAMRVRWDNHPDTPLSADVSAGENPPDGAIIYYYLKSAPAREITLEIRDEHGQTVRQFTSKAPAPDNMPKNVPDYWFAPPDVLSKNPGLNRFIWDLQWPHPATLAYSFRGVHLDYIEYTLPDHAIAGKTPRDQPPGPLVAPGKYEIVLTVDGKTSRQDLVVNLDPRVRVSSADLEAQVDLARMIDAWMNSSFRSYNDVSALRAVLAGALKTLAANPQLKEAGDAALALDKELLEIQDGTTAAPGFGAVNRDLARYGTMIQSGDMRPAESAVDSAGIACTALKNDLLRWRVINTERLPAFNLILKQAKLPPLATMIVENNPVCPN